MNLIQNLITMWSGGNVNGDTPSNGEGPIASAKRIAGINVDEPGVLQISAVMACVRLISQSIASLPVHLYRLDGQNEIREVNHPVADILQFGPVDGITTSMFTESLLSRALLRGQGYAEERYNTAGQLVALLPLSNDYLSVRDGAYVYRDPLTSKERSINPGRLFRLVGFTLDAYNGVSAITYGSQVFSSAAAAQTAANATFNNGLMPTVFFKFPNVVKADQRAQFKEYIKNDIVGALNAGNPPVLEGGMDAGTIGINPADAQLLESRKFSVEEICRWFNVPPHMVQHTSASTSWGSGLEQQVLGFLTFTLRPWIRRLEESYRAQLLSNEDRRKYVIRFDINDLLAADLNALGAFYTNLITNGVISRDEGRRRLGFSEIGGKASELTVNPGTTLLNEIGTNESIQTQR